MVELLRDAPRTLETARLVGRAPGIDDAPLLAGILSDPEAGPWLSHDGAPASAEKVAEVLGRFLARWREDGLGPWMFFDRQGHGAVSDFRGYGGLWRRAFDGVDEVELVYGALPEHWGQGFATEIGQATLSVAFETLRLPSVIAIIQPHNAASRAVAAKLGMRYEKDIENVGLPHRLYRIES
ncbi:MAG: GNAT family N-acetyltransferase [Alphaproteobacteria bacterium]|nr:GNAT family N-acetyltransferase [Alphaproteobacteria bacterium]